MNLVLSGPIDENLRNHVAGLVAPRAVVRLHDRAYRFEGAMDSVETRAAVEAACDGARVDHAYVEEGKKLSDFKLLAMDMDSTLITIECIDEIADFAGKKAEVAAITKLAMSGKIDFLDSLKSRVALLAGIDVSVLAAVFKERLRYSPGAITLISVTESAGLYRLLISGGFTYFTDRISNDLFLNGAFANQLEIQNNYITGKLIEPIIDANAKAAILCDTLKAIGAQAMEAIAIGDGANDIPLFAAVGYSIAYKASPSVDRAALWKIRHNGLDTLLDYLT